MRDGSFVSEKYIFADGTCFDRESGAPLEGEKANQCTPIKEKVDQELQYSDNIIYGDLFRFYDFGKSED